MIKAINVSKKYDNKTLFNNLSLTINSGESLAIVGRNGAGKSTLLKMLIGQIKPDNGYIKSNFDDNNKYKKIGVQLQNSELDNLLKVKEILEEFRVLQNISKQQMWKYIKLLDISSLLNKWPKNLSYGEKQKINILLAIVNNPQYLFLDEVTTGLDAYNRQQIYTILKNIKSINSNLSLILISHYSEEVYNLCDNIICLSKGDVLYQGQINAMSKNLISFQNNFNSWMR